MASSIQHHGILFAKTSFPASSTTRSLLHFGSFSTKYSTSSSKPNWPEAKLNLIPTSSEPWFSPAGFVANGLYSGVKKKKKDISLVLIEDSASSTVASSAVFTTNAFCAAPVQVSKKILLQSPSSVRGLVVNSGCANACTGSQGLTDAMEMAGFLAPQSSPSSKYLVMSTGVIGQPLQMNKIKKGLTDAAASAGSSFEHWMASAEGIMTTDTFPKLRSREFTRKGKNGSPSYTYRMAGWSKGAGMIHPNMATMLSAVFTDCKISQAAIKEACRYAADRSFNAISIDGDTSTNDTFAVIANGASESMRSVEAISSTKSEEYLEFRNNLTEFATELATLIVRDGEGATKLIKVKVSGAATVPDAKRVANSIVRSPLVKTAIYGKDANWGRIVCAVGYSAVPSLNPESVNLRFSAIKDPCLSLHLFKDGEPFQIDEEIASKILEHEDIEIHVDLGSGKEQVIMYTCDLSHEYISINADYRS